MKSDVLVADIGGTNARFAVARIDGDAVSLGAIETFRREDYETVEKAAAAFLLTVHAKPSAACFAVAGPITDDIVEFTNSPWVLDLAEVKKRLALDRIATDYANGTLRLTTRQTFQFHGVIKSNMRRTMQAIDAAALDTLRSRTDFADAVARRIATMTPAERRQFEALMKLNAAGRN